MDKDHYNTLELITHPDKDFKNHGHSKIFQYFFLIIVSLISFKVIFFYVNKKNNLLRFSFIFFIILLLQIINTYLVYLLDNFNSFHFVYFYCINFVFLLSAYFFLNKVLE